MIIDQEKINELKNNQPLKFEDALVLMRNQQKVYRQKWGGAFNIQLYINRDVVGATPAFVVENKEEFNLNIEDVLAEDWMLVN